MESSQESAVQLLKRIRGVSRLLASVLPRELSNPEDKMQPSGKVSKRAETHKERKKHESQ